MAYFVKYTGYSTIRNGVSSHFVTIIADTAADIPEPQENWETGSELIVVENGGKKYILNNARTWVEVPNFTSAANSTPQNVEWPDDGKTRFLFRLIDGFLDKTMLFALSADCIGTIDWGDGTVEALVATNTHSYTAPGEYTIVVDVTIGTISLPDYFMLNGDSSIQYAAGTSVLLALLKKCQLSIFVTSIGSYAFWGCDCLVDISIPCGLTSIGESAFWQNLSLNNFSIPDSVSSIGQQAFNGCKCISNITIPDGITELKTGLFNSMAGLRNITIPDTVTTIGNLVFCNTTNLVNITVPDSVTSLGDSVFSGCSNLETVSLPKSNVTIGNKSFYGCGKLHTVALPEDLVKISDYMFQSCTALSEIDIPNGVTSIGQYAFSKCSVLSTITVPDNVLTIGQYAFQNCTSLETVYVLPIKPPSISNYTFRGNTALTGIYVPAESVDAYKAATNWKDLADKIKAMPE